MSTPKTPLDAFAFDALDTFLDCFNRFRKDRRALLAQLRLNELQASVGMETADGTLRRIQRLTKGINRRIRER